ncbi:hypothetical protein P692DRAFT_201810473 [Suillus brevipes Sb2]|nr:hypothetical protein P692DRAFT_201810473 [Suillus brevipes Sb2]
MSRRIRQTFVPIVTTLSLPKISQGIYSPALWLSTLRTVQIFQSIIMGTVFLKLPDATSGFFSRAGVMFFALFFGALSSMADYYTGLLHALALLRIVTGLIQQRLANAKWLFRQYSVRFCPPLTSGIGSRHGAFPPETMAEGYFKAFFQEEYRIVLASARLFRFWMAVFQEEEPERLWNFAMAINTASRTNDDAGQTQIWSGWEFTQEYGRD